MQRHSCATGPHPCRGWYAARSNRQARNARSARRQFCRAWSTANVRVAGAAHGLLSHQRRAAVPSLLDNLPVWVSSESTCSGRGCDRRSGRFPTFEDRKRQLGNQALPTEGCVRETRSYLPVTSLIGRRSPAERCGGRASPAGDNRGAYLCCRLRVAPLVGDVVR